MLRPLIATATLLASPAALAGDCDTRLALPVSNHTTALVAEELELLGITTDDASDCDTAQAEVIASRDGTLRASVRLTNGMSAVRSLPSPDATAAWLSSWVRDDRVRGTLSDAGDEEQLFTLYATLQDFELGRPTGQVHAELLASTVDGPAEQGAMYTAKLTRREAKPLGSVFAFTVDGETYVNDAAPRLAKGSAFGPFERFGNEGMFTRKHCFWVPQTQQTPPHLECFLEVRHLDFGTGDTEVVTKAKLRKWLADAPELARAYDAEKPKHIGTTRTYLRHLLEHRSSAGGR
jgi:hypothetical protein